MQTEKIQKYINIDVDNIFDQINLACRFDYTSNDYHFDPTNAGQDWINGVPDKIKGSLDMLAEYETISSQLCDHMKNIADKFFNAELHGKGKLGYRLAIKLIIGLCHRKAVNYSKVSKDLEEVRKRKRAEYDKEIAKNETGVIDGDKLPF